MGAGRHLGADLVGGHIVGARHAIVEVAAGHQLSALLVIDAAFGQRLAYALGEPAVHLALDNHRIDDVAEIVHRGEVDDPGNTGVRIDLDFADMAAGREGEIRRIVERLLVQTRLELVVRVVVRHVGGERDRTERHGLVGARDREHAVLELDVGIGGLEQMRGDLLALVHHLVQRLDDGGAANRERARAVGAHAEQHAAGVAVHHVHVIDRYAQARGDHLRERRLMPLAMAVRAGEHRHLAGGVHANFARLEQARPGAEGTGNRGRRDAAGFDVAGVTQPALLAALRGLGAPRRESGDIGDFYRLGQRRFIVADVVLQRHRRLVGKSLDEIAPADFGRIELHLARRGFHQALDHVGRLGPARAAIGVDRRGVGEHRRHFGVDRRRGVLAGKQRGVKYGRHRGGEGREIGAHRRTGVHAHRQEFAVAVQREFGASDMVAPMRVRDEGLGALGGPLDRPVDLLRGPGQHHVLGVEENLGAEAPAHVGRDHPYFLLRQTEHERGHQQAFDVRVLVGDVERVGLVVARVARVDRARLDRIRDQAVVDELEFGHMRCRCHRLVHRALVAQRPDIAGVAGSGVVYDRRARLQRGHHIYHCRQHFVVHLDQLGGVPGLVVGLRDHHRDLVADVADLALRHAGVRRLFHRLGVDVGDQPAAGQAADLGRGEILAGEYRHHPRRLQRLVLFDRLDFRVRVRRAHEAGVALVRQGHVVGVSAGAGEKTVILLALDRHADGIHVTHDGPLLHFRRGGLHRLDDIVIAGAAAQIAVEFGADGLLGGVGMVVHQVDGAHHHARGAEAALQAMMLAKRLLHRMQRAIGLGQAFDGDDIGALCLHRQDVAAFHRATVQVNGAGAALTGVAADVSAGEAQVFADVVDQQRARLDFGADRLAVHAHRYLHESLLW